ncbi:MAG: cytidylate kinase-like family protein [Desulfobacteraceae bacterium]|jgi:cytidylate kinase
MNARKRSIEQLVDEQVKKWGFEHRSKSSAIPAVKMVTVSRDPGSGGKLIAQGIAEELNFDMFHQNVIHEMAESAKVSSRMLESLDEKGLSMLEDWVSSVVYKKHLWPDEYLQHLLKVIGTIGKHGRAVIVGRGANFILPRESTFRLRVSAPRDFRAQKVAQEFDIPLQDAQRRILKTESNRKAFIRKYFHSDIADPGNYDMVINTGNISLREAIEMVASLLRSKT